MEKWMVITAMTALISLVWANAAAIDEVIAHGAAEVIASAMVSGHTILQVLFSLGLRLGFV